VTRWIARSTAKLAAFGIAPPGRRLARRRHGHQSAARARDPCLPALRVDTDRAPRAVRSTACKALYRCEACREPFDYFKPH